MCICMTNYVVSGEHMLRQYTLPKTELGSLWGQIHSIIPYQEVLALVRSLYGMFLPLWDCLMSSPFHCSPKLRTASVSLPRSPPLDKTRWIKGRASLLPPPPLPSLPPTLPPRVLCSSLSTEDTPLVQRRLRAHRDSPVRGGHSSSPDPL